jgi:transposase
LVLELRAALNRDSTNSHKPPSSDGPKSQAERNKDKRDKKKRKKRGGQPGHKGHHRVMIDLDKVDKIIDCFADMCHKCDTALSGTDKSPHRHQVTELPVIKPEVTEYRLHRRKCPCCKAVTKGKLPSGLSASAFGPRLQAACTVLTGKYFLSKDEAVSAMSSLMGTELSPGSMCNIEKRMARALAHSMDEAQDFIKGSDTIHMDETSWRTDRERSWLWTASSGPIAMYAVCDERASVVAKELIGEDFKGLVHTDRYSAYSWLDEKQRQFCWAHLLRDFRAMSQRSGATGEVGDRLVELTHGLFSMWHKVRDGTMTRAEFRDKMVPVRKRFYELFVEGGVVGSAPHGGMCRNLKKQVVSLWRFVELEGVEPTNNEAERNMRRGVLWRRKSLGSDSVLGTVFTERVLTVVESLRRQKRDVLDFLKRSIEALADSVKPPSLLPAPS